MTKGFNYILFDFDSVIDKEISLLIYFYKAHRFSEKMSKFMQIRQLVGVQPKTLEFGRMYAKTSLFQELLISQEDKDRYEVLMELFFERDQKDIFDTQSAYLTSSLSLISAYRKAGDGVISTAVRCDNKDQVDFLKSLDPNINAFISKIEDVDMSKYARLIVGNYKTALKYNLNEPKSIVVLNFSENFDQRDRTLLQPELLINLGDIHDIRVASAYQEEKFVDASKGDS